MNESAAAASSTDLHAAGRWGAPMGRLLIAATDVDRIDALVDLVGSLAAPGALPALLDRLQSDPDLAARTREQTGRLIADAYPVQLLAETGIPTQHGFLAELVARISLRLVPQPRDGRRLAHLLPRIARRVGDLPALREVTPADRERLFSLLFPPPEDPAWSSTGRALQDAFRLLALRVESIGLSPEFRERGTSDVVTESPFFRFRCASDALLIAVETGDGVDAAAAAWRQERAACGEEMSVVRRRLGEKGIRVEIVFGMEVIARALSRMNVIVRVAAARGARERTELFYDLLAQIVVAARDDTSVRDHLVRNLHLLYRRIVDRSGAVGEHYIAQRRREYGLIWLLGAGGGAVAALIAIAKVGIHHAPLSPFLLGVAYGLAYSGGFLLMQRFDLILATKQPAMTAATMAGVMRGTGSDTSNELANLAARISVSQVAAAVSNVLLVTLAAYGFNWAWSAGVGQPLMRAEEALEVYRKYSPLDSLTVLYAAETGVILWLASIAGGWFDNWTALNEVPDGIAHSWRRTLGPARAQRWANGLRHGAGTFGTNVALGFMLGLAPEFGRFLGLPIDARHVTLSTGQLALAASALGYEWFRGGWFLRALAGIATMFVLNLTVSFLLSLFTAARALNMPARAVGAMLLQIVKGFLRNPIRFVFPLSWK